MRVRGQLQRPRASGMGSGGSQAVPGLQGFRGSRIWGSAKLGVSSTLELWMQDSRVLGDMIV